MAAIAVRIQESLSVSIALTELEDVGTRGLFEAAAEHENHSDVPFVTYINHRVRGVMLDWIGESSRMSRDTIPERGAR